MDSSDLFLRMELLLLRMDAVQGRVERAGDRLAALSPRMDALEHSRQGGLESLPEDAGPALSKKPRTGENVPNNEVVIIEQALTRARYELEERAGQSVASAAATVFLNALSDVAVRMESTGVAEEQSFEFYLSLSRRVCELLEWWREMSRA